MYRAEDSSPEWIADRDEHHHGDPNRQPDPSLDQAKFGLVLASLAPAAAVKQTLALLG
jgi:hypothetical protein